MIARAPDSSRRAKSVSTLPAPRRAEMSAIQRAEEEREIGVTVHVDEARTDDPAARVDSLAGRSRGEVADRLDAPAPDSDVGPVRRRAGPVHDEAAHQRAVEIHRIPPGARAVGAGLTCAGRAADRAGPASRRPGG
jgi:hypothetical protein